MTVWLIVTRHGARVVKRRPLPELGAWIVRLHVEFPPMPEATPVALVLPPQQALLLADAELIPEPEGE